MPLIANSIFNDVEKAHTQYKENAIMWFKRNPTATVALVINECLLSLVPAIIILYLFFMPYQMNEFLSTLLIVPYLALLINAVLIVISLFAGIFIKIKYRVGTEALVVERKYSVREIKYDEIASITYDLGYIFSQFNRTPSQLILFGRDGKQLLVVENPSVIMVHLLRKKCKDSVVYLENKKRILFFLALINGLVMLFGALIKIFNN